MISQGNIILLSCSTDNALRVLNVMSGPLPFTVQLNGEVHSANEAELLNFPSCTRPLNRREKHDLIIRQICLVIRLNKPLSPFVKCLAN